MEKSCILLPTFNLSNVCLLFPIHLLLDESFIEFIHDLLFQTLQVSRVPLAEVSLETFQSGSAAGFSLENIPESILVPSM